MNGCTGYDTTLPSPNEATDDRCFTKFERSFLSFTPFPPCKQFFFLLRFFCLVFIIVVDMLIFTTVRVVVCPHSHPHSNSHIQQASAAAAFLHGKLWRFG